MAEIVTTPDPSSVQTPTARRKTSFAGDVLKLVSGTAFAQLLTILASPILTRLYAPEAFGVLAIFTSITAIIGVVACLRYELAIMLPESDEEAANLLAVSLLFALLTSLLTVPLVWFGGASLVALLNAPSLASYLWLLPPSVFIGGVFLSLNYWASRKKQFGRLSIVKVSQSMTTVVANLGLGLAGFATGGALIGSSVGGQAIATTILGGKTWTEDKQVFASSIQPYSMRKGVSRYRKFPLVDLWSAMLNTFSIQLPSLMLAIFFSPVVVGFYAFGYRLLNLPMSLIGQSIAQVFFQRASASRIEGNLDTLVKRTFQQLVAIAAFPFLVLSITGPEIFEVVFGSVWVEAGLYAQILAPWLFFVFLGSPVSTLISVLEIQEVYFLFNLILISSRLSSLLVGGLLQDIVLALTLFSISGAVLWAWFSIYVTGKSGIEINVIVKILLRQLSVSLLFALPIISGKWILQLSSFSLVVVAVISSVIYYVFVVFHDEELRNFAVRFALKE